MKLTTQFPYWPKDMGERQHSQDEEIWRQQQVNIVFGEYLEHAICDFIKLYKKY